MYDSHTYPSVRKTKKGDWIGKVEVNHVTARQRVWGPVLFFGPDT